MAEQISGITDALVVAGIIKKAEGPTVGKAPVEPEPDMGELEDRVRNMSFQEINYMREAVGDLSLAQVFTGRG